MNVQPVLQLHQLCFVSLPSLFRVLIVEVLNSLRFALCGLCLCFVCAFDLPSCMTGVYVDVILNCFFSRKDRTLERNRPYREKK